MCEVGPWLDEPFGPRQAVRSFLDGREADGAMMLLYAAQEGYEVAQYSAAWVLVNDYAHSLDKIITRGFRSAQIISEKRLPDTNETALALANPNSRASNRNSAALHAHSAFVPREATQCRRALALSLLEWVARQTSQHMAAALLQVRAALHILSHFINMGL